MSDDRMNDRLTDAGTRWREGHPDRHVAVPALRQRSSRLPILVAAGLVLAVAGAGWGAAQLGDGAPSPAPSSTPTSSATTPSLLQPPLCTAPELQVTHAFEGAMGTTYMSLTVTTVRDSCQLPARPDVTLLDHGSPIDVTVQPIPGDHYQGVAITPDRAATLSIGWAVDHSCANVDNDSITVTLPDSSTIDVPGFGPTSCSPGEADLQPLLVGKFGPVATS